MCSRSVGVRNYNRAHHFLVRDKFDTVFINVTDVRINHYKYKSWQDYLRKFESRIGPVVDWKMDGPTGPLTLEQPRWSRHLFSAKTTLDKSVINFRDRLYHNCNSTYKYWRYREPTE